MLFALATVGIIVRTITIAVSVTVTVTVTTTTAICCSIEDKRHILESVALDVNILIKQIILVNA